MNREIVIFGAGKIGRSFIGQLFGCSGYRVVFIDVDLDIVERMNLLGSYSVIVKDVTSNEIVVPHVSAIAAKDVDKVVAAVSKAGILAVSVGKNALRKVMPVIAEGLKLRFDKYPQQPLDMILAENMLDAAAFVYDQLAQLLPQGFPLDAYVGLVETSIGKMVPIMPLEVTQNDPLLVYAEAYNTLILDEKGFKNTVPQVAGLAPKSNIKAWVDRKAFIHNLGHATAAYCGHYLHPQSVYLYEVLEDVRVLDFTRSVMMQSAAALQKTYPDDFSASDLESHVEDLLQRFQNQALKDTVYRVGHDLVRKLGQNDRFMGAVRLAQGMHLPFDRILAAMSFAFCFRPLDEGGKPYGPDMAFLYELDKEFFPSLIKYLGFDEAIDKDVIQTLCIVPFHL